MVLMYHGFCNIQILKDIWGSLSDCGGLHNEPQGIQVLIPSTCDCALIRQRRLQMCLNEGS